MIGAFPTTKAYFVAGVSLSFLIAAGMIHENRGIVVSLLVFGFGMAISWFVSSFIALINHRKLLNILYREMKPKDFITAYSPVVKSKQIRKNIRFSMMCFLSNAYSAAGEYNTALEILNSIPVLNNRKQRQSKAILTGNRCDIYCAMRNSILAEKEFKDLEEMVNAGEISQKSVLDLLKVKLNLIENNVSEKDCERVRATINGSLTPLFQLQLHYLLAELYEQQGEHDFARAYYEEAASGNIQLAIVREAKTKIKNQTLKP